MKKRKLTDQQKLFCQHYLVTVPPNAKAAALLAGYSPESAESQGSRLLRNAQVRKFLSAAQVKVAKKFEVQAEDVLKEIHRLAMVDIGDLFDKTGKLKAVKDLPPSVRKAIASVETSSVESGEELDDGAPRPPVITVTKVKFWDKTKGLQLLGQHLGLFTNKVEHSGKVGLNVAVKDVTPPLSNEERRELLKRQLAAEKEKTPDDVPHRT